jgi:hypothetical protein
MNPAEIADYEWLTGKEAASELLDLADRDEPLHVTTARLRKRHSAARAHLLIEQVKLRQRGGAKFERADSMFFTRLGLEQATDQWVAAYKARRFAAVCDEGPIADLCCGIGGDLLALARVADTVGVDRDSSLSHLARSNISANNCQAAVEIADVDGFDASRFTAWHLDPDRRPQGRRTTAVEWSSPGIETIDRLLAQSPHAAIKLAPAAEVPPDWTGHCELEWISRDRECRQLVAWHGALAAKPSKHTATALSPDGQSATSFTGEPISNMSFAELDQYLIEPDSSVLAADLCGALAQLHGLSAVSAGIAYLTGPEPVDSPLLASFSVEEVLPLDLRKVGEALRERRIGRLEIKKRGVEHDPQQVRKQLRLAGDNQATLVLTKLHGKHAAILAHRIGAGSPVPPLNTQP